MKFKIIIAIFLCLGMVFCASTGKKNEENSENDPHYQYNLGLLYLNNGDTNEALKYLKKATSLDPRHFLAFNAIGLSYYLRGNFNEALEAFKRCLEIKPGFTEVHNNLGTVYLEMGIINKAEEEYNKVLQDETYSSREVPYFNLAKMNLNQGKLEAAEEYVEKAIYENSRFASAYNLKGLIFEKRKNLIEAIRYYEQAVNLVPNGLSFQFDLAAAFFKNKNLKKAKEIFENIFPKIQDPEMKKKINSYLNLLKKRERP